MPRLEQLQSRSGLGKPLGLQLLNSVCVWNVHNKAKPYEQRKIQMLGFVLWILLSLIFNPLQ
ncbi:hypothetical protein RchiOBHm_Chr7g0241411 [Rosa chinensis]|uniref:Uncharacterized protein n=1 Tax=Rosa chinensis TaxID=74649 RepID=A0A2P6PI80_ROSCH|nr:hypothetical protein RchiOBHm_Chr7g0241411 [Rosa chinensis]